MRAWSGRATCIRNWFDSRSGECKGRKVGHPRSRFRKDNRQSIRLTRNGFGVSSNGVAKVADVRLEWPRALLSEPSSVTVIRETDGRYYASFVVAAGPAETQSARGGGVRRGLVPAAAGEARAHEVPHERYVGIPLIHGRRTSISTFEGNQQMHLKCWETARPDPGPILGHGIKVAP